MEECDKAMIEFIEEMMEASTSVGLLLHAALALYMTVLISWFWAF